MASAENKTASKKFLSLWNGLHKKFGAPKPGPHPKPSMDGGPDLYDEYKNIYTSFQDTLQTLMTVSTLLMGFIITGSFISVAYASDATYTQEQLVKFVWKSLCAFAGALVSFSLSLILSVLGQQCFSTRICVCDAVICFRSFSFLMLISEIYLYKCGIDMANMAEDFVQFNYISPSINLCPGQNFSVRGDSFCAQLGNDLHQAALDICGGKAQRPPRPFYLGHKATGDQRTLAVCNQLDWYEQTEVNPLEANPTYVWFGWDTYPLGGEDWTGVPMDKENKINQKTIMENNGKILGEVMCYKNEAQKYLTQACKTSYEASNCTAARSAYIAADQCAGQKFNDVVQCYHACKWNAGMSTKDNWHVSADFENIRRAVQIWMWIRIISWLVFGIGNYCELCVTCLMRSKLTPKQLKKAATAEQAEGVQEVDVQELIVTNVHENSTSKALVGDPVSYTAVPLTTAMPLTSTSFPTASFT